MSDQVSTIEATGALTRTGVRWNIFFLMLFLVSINYIDRASLSVAMPLISREFNLDPALQGLILSSFFWTYAIMQVPGGMLADRFKPRIVIALATIFWGAFQAIAAVATSWWVLLLTRLGLGASEAPIYPAGGKLNAIWMTQTERGRGATLLDGGAPLGAALGSIVIAWLIAAFDSWRMAFVIVGLPGLVLASLMFAIREPKRLTSLGAEESSFKIEEIGAFLWGEGSGGARPRHGPECAAPGRGRGIRVGVSQGYDPRHRRPDLLIGEGAAPCRHQVTGALATEGDRRVQHLGSEFDAIA